ncbi:MAG: molybdopterin-guanine dinucleotide biosynthesis protein B [Proteobacteria bacterium]|nr:molybdopterin-guanine dinucleotide biosynthesis protein B [Pseudomonadota bacterium]MBU1737293.1 molybdopterin-guanine dinucleotide biosynthesis protein B [Pseudomonadota bacterium]
MAPAILALVGKPDCGKTTLLERLIPELNRRGFRIGTIKHHVHAFEMDLEGKDTWRHKRAGARTVALSSPTGLGIISDVDHDQAANELLDRYFPDIDLVIAEGYKKSSLPKIEVFRKEAHATPLENRDNSWLAMVSDDPLHIDLPQFGHNDTRELADFICRKFLADQGHPQASLFADGKPIALNNFLEKFLRQAVTGMITSLKGCSKAEKITLTIHRKNDHERR